MSVQIKSIFFDPRVEVWHAIRTTLLWCLLLVCGQVSAQTTAKGTVVDATGEAVIGATVVEKGSPKNATVTDFDGNFTLKLQKGKVVVISYIGMVSQEVNAGPNMKITLKDDNTTLNDLVVIGYGTVRKKDLTGSVATVKGENLTKVPVPNVGEAMAGKLSGVRVTTTDGSPDAEVVIRVRGGGGITSDNTPLFIVDGFPTNSINDISANDIEDITVLKDASSTAIYGSQGANGVILITTKGAQSGKTRINYNGFVQTKKIAKRLDAMNTYDYVMSNYEYAALRGSSAISSFEKNFGVYDDLDIYKSIDAIDWQEDMFGANVASTQQNISISGGTDKTSYSLSGTYDFNGGLMPNNDFSRFSFNMKIKHQLNKALTFNLNAKVSDTETNGSGTQGGNYKIRTSQAITSVATKGLSNYITPDFSSMSDDEYQEYLTSQMSLAEQANRYWRRRNQRRFQFNASLDWKTPLKGLTAHIEGGYTYGFNETKNWWGHTTSNASYEGGEPLAEWQKQNTNTIREEFHVTYDKKLAKIHHFNIMVGQELNIARQNYNLMHGSRYSRNYSPEMVFDNFSKGQGTPTVKSYTNAEENMLSFFGRINYTLLDRYLFTFTAREDGSSKFSDGHRWGFFPAAAASWRVIEEPWMENTHSWLSNLKLRLSFGTAGNNKIPSGAALDLYYFDQGSKRYGVGDVENHHYGIKDGSRAILPNPDLTWETTITRNLGLDFGLLNERINGSIDLYWNSTKDLLVMHTITAPGFTHVYENCGKTTNKGVEIQLNASILQKKNFTLDANFNIGFNKSKVDEIKDGIDYLPFASGWASTDNKNQEDYIVRVGEPIGLIYGWKSAGYYTTDDFSSYDAATGKYILKEGVANVGSLLGGTIGVRPGTMKLVDVDGNGTIGDEDRVVIGDTNPTCQGGFGLNMTFLKNFDLSANFTFSIGNEVYNANKIASSQQYRSGTYPNMLNDMRPDNSYSYLNPETGQLLTSLEDLKYWNEGGNGKGAKEYWSPYSFGSAVIVPTDWAIEDASFLRLQSVTLGYTLPQNITKKVGISNCRVYFTATNLFCITKYTGYDPEVSSYARNNSYSSLTPGIDYSSYPKSRGYTFGLNVSF